MFLTEGHVRENQVIRRFFDSIALRYDGINDFLILRLDHRWRRKSLEMILEGNENTLLDLGTGTGKFIELFLKAKKWDYAAGLDFSQNMLDRAAQIIPRGVEWIRGDFQNLPFESGRFDLVISAFALRSVRDLGQFLSGVFRVLSPKGKAGILCLTRPESKFWRALTYPYLKFYLPLIGGLFTGSWQAYRFLSDSILTFQEPEKTAFMMKEAGFQQVEIHRMSLGLATLILARK